MSEYVITCQRLKAGGILKDGAPREVELMPHQRAAALGNGLYVVRADAMLHLSYYLDNLASEVMHTMDDEKERAA